MIQAVALIILAAPQQPRAPRPATLGLERGTKTYSTPDFKLKLGADSGVAVGLVPNSGGTFDFLPSDRLTQRASDGFVHLGDIEFRVRRLGEQDWRSFSTFRNRRSSIQILGSNVAGSGHREPKLAGYDLAPSLGPDCPLTAVRNWTQDRGKLRLSFTLTNRDSASVELGALGIPMPFNNIISNRSLVEAHARCSFTDPYIGEDAGYLRVCRLSGTGPNMIVTPVGHTSLEAWQLVNEPMRPNQTFEGMMEWMVHTKALAETAWKGVEEWNEPTGETLRSGETRTYGFQFTPVNSIRGIEDALAREGRPVAVGIPGYILPSDQTASLFLRYRSKVARLSSSGPGQIECVPSRDARKPWAGYHVRGRGWGRSRLTIQYADGTRQVVSYWVTKPAPQAVADLGHFLTTKAWFTQTGDPFGRAPSAITYDGQAGQQVVQDSRVWIAGLGDEGGSGNWLALAMKEFGQPVPEEVEKLESFIDGVLWGNLQFKSGPKAYGVRKSVFFYDPKLLPDFPYNPNFNWKSWTSWSKNATDDVGRGYNYPHVVAAYWAMYRVARNHPSMVRAHPWTWYLDQAFRTTEFLTSQDERGRDRVGYWRLGMMDGSVFMALLDDLRMEGWADKAALIESRMRERADRWKTEPYPFGSEMAWDSTGQEEVYGWCKRFGYEDKAQVTLNSILAYDPTVPHWGYNGCARRYWDFLYAGKLSRIERQLHHYGSGLNAIPLLTEYRQHPDDLYLLRVGYGGSMGALASIDQEGFASAAFHSFPSTLRWDAISGDYGPNFFGHSFNSGAYLVDTKDFGWQGFGGDVRRDGEWVVLRPLDSFRSRVYLAPKGAYVTLSAGRFRSVSYNTRTGRIRILLEPADELTQIARMTIQSPGGMRCYAPVAPLRVDGGAFTIPLDRAHETDVELMQGIG